MNKFTLYVTFLVFITFPSGLFAQGNSTAAPAAASATPAATSGTADVNAGTPGPAPASSKEKETEPKTPSKPLAVTEEALREMENRERSLAEKEKEISEREQAVQVQEKVLQNKLKRIEEVSNKMAAKLDKFKEESESKVVKIVAMLETMKPDAAAAYIENVDPYLAVEVMARIKVDKVAKIWNKMDKKISARLTELYTGFRSKMDKPDSSPGPSPASTKPATQGKG